MPIDYYTVLGVRANSTLAEIKSAYRQRALELHPDRTGAESGPFRQLQEAYDVLSDPATRRRYDQSRHAAKRPSPRVPAEPLNARHPSHAGHYPNPNPVAQRVPAPSLLQQVGDLRAPSHPRPSLPERPQTAVVNVRLDRHQAREGGEMRLQIPLEVPCPACHGRRGYSHYRCPHCAGAGTAMIESGVTVTYPPGVVSTHLARVPVHLPGSGLGHILVRFHVA